jgi:tyrosyl-tRNA synthetase
MYCGYDPTNDSLHLGNLISIIMLARMSLHKINPIFLIGGATGFIGDPSGKSK